MRSKPIPVLTYHIIEPCGKKHKEDQKKMDPEKLPKQKTLEMRQMLIGYGLFVCFCFFKHFNDTLSA